MSAWLRGSAAMLLCTLSSTALLFGTHAHVSTLGCSSAQLISRSLFPPPRPRCPPLRATVGLSQNDNDDDEDEDESFIADDEYLDELESELSRGMAREPSGRRTPRRRQPRRDIDSASGRARLARIFDGSRTLFDELRISYDEFTARPSQQFLLGALALLIGFWVAHGYARARNRSTAAMQRWRRVSRALHTISSCAPSAVPSSHVPSSRARCHGEQASAWRRRPGRAMGVRLGCGGDRRCGAHHPRILRRAIRAPIAYAPTAQRLQSRLLLRLCARRAQIRRLTVAGARMCHKAADVASRLSSWSYMLRFCHDSSSLASAGDGLGIRVVADCGARVQLYHAQRSSRSYRVPSFRHVVLITKLWGGYRSAPRFHLISHPILSHAYRHPRSASMVSSGIRSAP